MRSIIFFLINTILRESSFSRGLHFLAVVIASVSDFCLCYKEKGI